MRSKTFVMEFGDFTFPFSYQNGRVTFKTSTKNRVILNRLDETNNLVPITKTSTFERELA